MLGMLHEGKRFPVMAEVMHIKPASVRHIAWSMYRKIGANNRVHAVVLSRAMNLPVAKLTTVALICACLLSCTNPTTQGQKKVLLQWQQSGAVDSFNIYRGGHQGEGFIASVPGNTLTYLDVKLQPNKQFCYVVTSVRGGIESTRSNEACVQT